MAPLVRTGGSRHTGLAAPPHRNIQAASSSVEGSVGGETSTKGIILLETSGVRFSRQVFSPVFHLRMGVYFIFIQIPPYSVCASEQQ